MKKPTLALLPALLLSLQPASALAQEKTTQADIAAEKQAEAGDITGAQLAAILKQVSEQMALGDVIAPLIEEMLITGPVEEGWSTKGINLIDYLESREGGAAAQLLVEQDPDTVTVSRLGGDQIAFPTGYRKLTLSEGPKSDQMEHVMAGFAPGFWIGGSAPYKLKGNAMCTSATATSLDLYTDRSVSEWGDVDMAALAFFYGLMDDLGKIEFCTVYYEAEDGRLTYRVFSSSGEPFVTINASNSPKDVRPAAKAAGLISGAKLTNPFAGM